MANPTVTADEVSAKLRQVAVLIREIQADLNELRGEPELAGLQRFTAGLAERGTDMETAIPDGSRHVMRGATSVYVIAGGAS